MKDDIDLENLRYESSTPTKFSGRKKPAAIVFRPAPGEKFLKGPIPWNWIQKASTAPGGALNVAVALWFFIGLSKSLKVGLNMSRLKDLGLSRDSARRGLSALESAKLVTVERHAGRKPIVTVLLTAKPATMSPSDEMPS